MEVFVFVLCILAAAFVIGLIISPIVYRLIKRREAEKEKNKFVKDYDNTKEMRQ